MDKKKLCKGCRERFSASQMVSHPIGNFHSFECAMSFVESYQKKIRNKKLKAVKRETTKIKKKLKSRTGKNGFYANLRTAIHYYVKHVLRPNDHCYTCDKIRNAENRFSRSFHVGHFIPAKLVDPRRFLLANMRIQCYSCNTIHSGRRMEYKEKLIKEMGVEHVEWLENSCNFASLKMQYPSLEDILKEIKKYNKINNEHKKGKANDN